MGSKIVYFIFSKKQLELRNKAASKIGKKFIPGKVVVKGVNKPFTEISENPNSQYSDAVILIKGDISKIKYTTHKTE